MSNAGGTRKYAENDEQQQLLKSKRTRRVLSLEERYFAIQAFDEKHEYKKVAKIFNCSWVQIKKIILNRDTIVHDYECYKNMLKKQGTCINTENNTSPPNNRKAAFLKRALWEYKERVRYHHGRTLSLNAIFNISTKLQYILKINFKPDFRDILKYLDNKVSSRRTPPASLNLLDIISYCSRVEMPSVPQKPQLQYQLPNPIVVQTITPEHTHDHMNLKLPENDPHVEVSKQTLMPIEPPPLKIQKVESFAKVRVMPQLQYFKDVMPVGPEKFEENQEQFESTTEENPIKNHADALKYLSYLEEFAMLESNYRAIGLLGQLEQVLKNPPHQVDELQENILGN